MAKGLTRAIGISNFSINRTEKLLKTAKIIPAVNQVELHAYFQQPKLRQYYQRWEKWPFYCISPLLYIHVSILHNATLVNRYCC